MMLTINSSSCKSPIKGIYLKSALFFRLFTSGLNSLAVTFLWENCVLLENFSLGSYFVRIIYKLVGESAFFEKIRSIYSLRLNADFGDTRKIFFIFDQLFTPRSVNQNWTGHICSNWSFNWVVLNIYIFKCTCKWTHAHRSTFK